MKTIEIRRDRDSGRLRFVVREDRKTLQSELSTQTEVRKLRRYLRRTYGRSTRLSRLGA
jgi:hypothetical protein